MTRPRPTDPALEAELARGVALHRAGRTGEAEAAYRSVLARAPEHAFALNYLGTLLASSGRLEEGIELLRRSVKRAAGVPELHLNLADAMTVAGRLDGAEAALKKALQLRRGPEVLVKLGRVLLQQGKLRPAAHQLEQALAIAPDDANALVALAVVRAQLDDSPEARTLFAKAIALIPTHTDAINGLATLSQQHGEPTQARAWLRRAIAIAPGLASAHGNLATTLDVLAERDASLRHARIALALGPAAASGWVAYGNATLAAGAAAAAETRLRRASVLAPGDPLVWSNLGRALAAQGRFLDARRVYLRGLDLAPGLAPLRSNLLYLSQLDPGWSQDEILTEHAAYGRIQEAQFRSERRAHANARDPGRRIRIGYVSPDLARHPVGFFLSQVAPHHDSDAIEVFYYSDRVIEDAMTETFRRDAALFRRTASLTDRALADLVRADGIDVLIDLAGHTAGNRLPVFARRPAPVQLSWLGYFGTTGLTTIDAVLADPWEVGPEDERWYVEKVERLATGRLCYGPPADAPAVSPAPLTTAGQISLGCFNRPVKITDEVISTWSRIMAAVPEARLVLRSQAYEDPGFRAGFVERCRAFGIAPGRLDLGATGASGSLAAYATVDLALDPFPFTGGLTTCEALWMGVPVVTLRGDRPVSRQAVSFLSRVGLESLVTDSTDAYVETVLALARDPRRLAAIRNELRPRMAASPLTDGEAAARAVETAIRRLWRSWCAKGA